MDQQMKLGLDTGRTRVLLVEDAPVRKRRALVTEEVVDDFSGVERSPWVPCTEHPPVSGEWELRPYENDKRIFRAHFNKQMHGWTTPLWPFPVVSLGQCEWRGLARDPNAKA